MKVHEVTLLDIESKGPMKGERVLKIQVVGEEVHLRLVSLTEGYSTATSELIADIAVDKTDLFLAVGLLSGESVTFR